MDTVQRVRDALVGCLKDDPTLRSLTGRYQRIIARVETWDLLPMPGLTYAVIVAPTIGGVNQPVRVLVQLTAWADGEESQRTAAALLEAAIAGLQGPAWAAQGLDAVIDRMTRRVVPVDQEGPRFLARDDMDIEVRVQP